VPVGHVLVCDAGSDIEHDDTALAVDVVAITETAKLLLTSGIPHIELNLAKVLRSVRSIAPRRVRSSITYGGEAEWVYFDSEGGHVLLFELARQVALDEGGLHKDRQVSQTPQDQGVRNPASKCATCGAHDKNVRWRNLPCRCHHRQRGRA